MPVLLHTSFKKTYPCKILPPPFFNLSDPPPLGEAIKIYFPPLQRGGGGELCQPLSQNSFITDL